MAKRRSKQYAKAAQRKSFMQGFSSELNTKGNIKNTALETGKDILVGVLGGGLIGAAIGRPSLAVGIVATGFGHYKDNKLIQLLGLGMMAASGFQGNNTVSGLEGMDGVKERVMAFRNGFTEKLYLDKLKKKSASATATNGFGDTQYFNYPGNDLAALDAIEDQLTDSAMQFRGNLPDTDFGDTALQFDELDAEGRLL